MKVVNGKVKTAITDAGASSTCGQVELSECGNYRLNLHPFIATSRKSEKTFQYASGRIAAEEEINQLSFKVRG